jgi:superfamily I DNA/RNA helicase
MAKPYIIIHPCFDGDDEAKFIAHQISQLLLDPVSNPDDLNLKSFAMSLPLASRSSSSTPLIHPSQPTAKPALEKLTVAILVRSAWQFQAFEEQLMLRSVPYVLEGGASFFARPDLRFPLTLLRAITFADDDLAFTEVSRHACCGSVGEATLQDLKVLASEQACSLKTASELAVVEGLVKSSRSATGLSDLVSKLNRWRELIKQCLMSTSDPTSLQPDTFDTLGAEALNLPLGSNDAKARLAAVVRQIFYESGYYTFLEQRRKSRSSGGSASVSPQSGKLRGRGSVTRRTKALALSSSDPSKTVDELSRAAGSFESIEAFLRNVALQSGGAAVGGAGAGTAGGGVVVRLMTMHRAKGREFTHVFAAGWEEGVFPLHPGALLAEPVVSSGGRAQAASRRNAEAASASASSDFDTAGTVEEERRLAYVALTRASGSVVLTHAQRRKLQNTWFATRRSRFLAELPNEHVRVSPTIFGAHTNRRPDYLNGPRPVLEFQEEPVRSSSTKIEVGASALRAGKESSVCVSQQLWGYNPWTNFRKEGTFSSALELQEGEENSEFQPRTVQELKSELRAWGLPLSGKKVELMQRLKLHQQQKQSERQRSADAPSDDSVIGGNEVPEYLTQVELERRTVTELKALLRAKGLRISGKKADLVQRALAAPLNPMPVSSSPSAKSGIPLIPTSALQSVQKGQQLDINVNSCDSPAKKVAAWGGAAESAKEAAVLRLSASMSLQQLRASLKARGLRFATGSKMLLARRLHDVILAENAAEHSETQQRHHRKELLPEKEDVSSKDKKSSLAASVLKPPVLINQMKVAALRTELRARGLPQSGTKAELISRLRRASSFFEE